MMYATSAARTAARPANQSIDGKCRTADNGIVLTCAQLNQAMQAQAAKDAPSAMGPISCAGGRVCTCTTKMGTMTDTEIGSYTVSGNRLTVVSADGTTSAYDFCVDGSSLALMEVPALGEMADPTLVLYR